MDILIDFSGNFHVATSESTFSSDAFRNGMERVDFYIQIQLQSHFSEWDELLVLHVNILLIHFICENYNFLLGCKLYHFDNALFIEYLTCGIARVDTDKDSWSYPILLGLFILCFQFTLLSWPTFFLNQIVGDLLGSTLGDDCWIKWILWNWDHYSIFVILQQQIEHQSDSCWCPISQQDIIDVRSLGCPISPLDEVC